jgi:hypothetical protein
LGSKIVVSNLLFFTVQDEIASGMPDGMSDTTAMSEKQEATEMNQQRDKTMTNKKHREKGTKNVCFYFFCLNDFQYGGKLLHVIMMVFNVYMNGNFDFLFLHYVKISSFVSILIPCNHVENFELEARCHVNSGHVTYAVRHTDVRYNK